jgi:hypothetical protein
VLASRIASLFTRTEIAKNPEPTKPKLVRDKSSIEDKRTAASVHVSQQLDDESTKNIKCQFKKRPVPNNLDTQSEKLNTAYQFNSNDSKTLQSEAPISETNTTPEIPEETIDNRSCPDLYKGFLDRLPAAGRELGETYKLNECEMAAIVCYTGDDHKEINATLRSLTGTDVDFYNADSLKSFGVNEHLSEIISDLSNGLKKLPPARTDGKTSFGLGRDITLEGDALKRMKEGAVISDRMFTSTTTRLEQTVEGDWWVNNGQVWTIHQRVDGNGRDIAAFSGYDGEGEILFLPDTKFLITYREDNAIVGSSGNWEPIFKQLNKAFFDAFPKEYVDKLNAYEYEAVKAALGTLYPLDFKSAAEKMEEKFPGIFFIKSATIKMGEVPEKITIKLKDLHKLSRKLHAEEYGGGLEPGTGFNKIVIAMQEISPDEELKINLEKSQATAGNEITLGISSNMPDTSQSERKIPIRGQNNASEKTEGKIPVRPKDTKSAETERKIPVRDQSKTTAQPSTAAKPSSTNKPNFKSDDYSASDASNYGEYFPGFRE